MTRDEALAALVDNLEGALCGDYDDANDVFVTYDHLAGTVTVAPGGGPSHTFGVTIA